MAYFSTNAICFRAIKIYISECIKLMINTSNEVCDIQLQCVCLQAYVPITPLVQESSPGRWGGWEERIGLDPIVFGTLKS